MRTWMLALVPVLVAAPASGQAERQAPQARAVASEMRAPVLEQVEHALRLRGELNLAESQVERLDALRREILNRQTDQAEEGRELMSRMRAGLVEREEAVRLRTEARETRRAEANSLREQFDAILSDEQRQQLREERVAAVRGRRMSQRVAPVPPRLRAMPVPPRARVMPPRARLAPMPPRSMRPRGDGWGWQGNRFDTPRLRRYYEYGSGSDIRPWWRQRD
jgi:hypothetical protein